MNKRLILISSIITLILLLISVSAIIGLKSLQRNLEENVKGTEKVDLSYIKDFGRISLPPSTSDLHAFTRAGIDAELYVKITIKSGDLKDFWQGSACLESETITERSGEKPEDLLWADGIRPWWNPQIAKKFDFRQFESPTEGFTQNILVDKTEKDRCTVFITCFTR